MHAVLVGMCVGETVGKADGAALGANDGAGGGVGVNERSKMYNLLISWYFIIVWVTSWYPNIFGIQTVTSKLPNPISDF